MPPKTQSNTVVKRIGQAVAWIALGVVLSALALHAIHWAATAGPLRGLDPVVLQMWHRATPHDSNFGLFLMGWSKLVTAPVVWPLLAFTSWILGRKGRFYDAIGLVCAVSMPAVVALAAKAVYNIPRPNFDWAMKSNWSSAYPSGHVAIIFALCGLTSFIGWREGKSAGWVTCAVIFTTVGTVLMAYSRVVLGAHFFSDVLGGGALGFIWLPVSIAVTRTLQPPLEVVDNTEG